MLTLPGASHGRHEYSHKRTPVVLLGTVDIPLETVQSVIKMTAVGDFLIGWKSGHFNGKNDF